MNTRSRLIILLLCASAAHAQYLVNAPVGMIYFTEGEVYLNAQQPIQATPPDFPLMTNGQVLRIGSGRAEIILAPGVFLRLDSQAAMKMLDYRLEDTQAELQKGTALIEVVQLPKDGRPQIKLGETATSFKGMGLYRFQADSRELRIFGGSAEVRAGDRKLDAGRGRMVRLGSPPSSSKFNTKETDAFHDWAARRSFLLYSSSAEARRQITNWEATASGQSWNRDFNMWLFSPIVAQEYRDALAREAAEKQEQAKQQQKAQQQQQEKDPKGPSLSPEEYNEKQRALLHQQQRQQQQQQDMVIHPDPGEHL